ncbi:MAG: SanA protein [Lachnospiraceae bacterium]|nr:SanA protein [Lachnospiraceae bacterium]
MVCLGILGVVAVLGINGYVKNSVKDRIITTEEAAKLKDIDCVIVLGCLVRADGTPSHMLEDRIKRGVELYKADASPKIIMSGDHGRTDYNEVQTMKEYAIADGVESSDVFMDHAGFSTYDTVYRAKEIFQADKVIIVTQEYHLSRALYIAKALGIEAYGVAADYRTYSGQTSRDIREVLARVKDFATTIIKPEPTYLGDTIPVSGDGDVTND